MASFKKKYTAIMVLIATMLSCAVARPRYVECTDDAECSVDTCCILGMGKFSVPQCKQNGQLGHPCKFFKEGDIQTFNSTLIYPDGQIVDVTNVYSSVCPCAQGLYCSRETGTCRDPLEDVKYNEIDYFKK